ncbi:MAG: RNA polymerase subunit sigma-70 [Anaerolineae bacterium]|nr:RNA polymerase subunit sigma-70 [Anaerolineae bacterium]
MNTSPSDESIHLTSARAGNNEAFTALVEPHRKPLLVHCYRMSGSLDDAEDLVQETFLRAWSKLKSYDGHGSFRNWLYVIATRLWLDEFRKRRKRIFLPIDGDPADPDSPPRPDSSASFLDPLPASWLTNLDPTPEFSYERRETISFAFMVALQKLNARQRVVLILREVFNWSAEEVAGALELTVDSVNNLLYRARKNLEPSPFEETPAPKQYLNQFVNAWESGDVHSLIDLLHQKATFAMPPMGVWYAGRESIQRALQNLVFMPRVKWKLIPTAANGGPAFGIYRADEENFQAAGLLLPIFSNDKIVEVTAFLSPKLVTRFGLPQDLLP